MKVFFLRRDISKAWKITQGWNVFREKQFTDAKHWNYWFSAKTQFLSNIICWHLKLCHKNSENLDVMGKSSFPIRIQQEKSHLNKKNLFLIFLWPVFSVGLYNPLMTTVFNTSVSIHHVLKMNVYMIRIKYHTLK